MPADAPTATGRNSMRQARAARRQHAGEHEVHGEARNSADHGVNGAAGSAVVTQDRRGAPHPHHRARRHSRIAISTVSPAAEGSSW